MERHILPCRYCDAPTYMERLGDGVCMIRNPDGTLHECHEAERAKAIHTIFWGQVEDACLPQTPRQTLETLKALYDCLACFSTPEEDLYAVNGAIEMLKLVVGGKWQSPVEA